jgi:predicted NACHT family NTPase
LASLDSYAVLTVKPLTKPQSEKLVNRAPFSEHVKQRFLHEMQGDNYNTHLSFFSNPLLLSIMLVGFEDMGSIPFKRSLLYEQIFMSLYQKHDARKELFRRVLSSELPRDEFQRLLNAFGFQTYLRWSLSFKHNEVVKYIDEALHQTGIHRKRQQISTDDVLKDMLTAICILQEEGGIYEYVHKSFQEYFCCSFIKNYRGKRLPSILKMVVSDFSDISCLELLTEMCGGLLEREVMEPTIDFLLEAVPKHLAPKEAAPYLALRTHPDATVSHDGYRIFHVDVKQNHRLSRFLNWIAIYVDNPRPSRQVSTEPVSKALLLETQREILLRAIREQEDDGKTISPGFEAFHNDSRLSENERRHIGRRNTQISLPRDLLQIDPKLTDALWSSGLVDEMDVVNLYAAKEAIAATQREDDEQVDKMMNAARRERSKRHQGGEA